MSRERHGDRPKERSRGRRRGTRRARHSAAETETTDPTEASGTTDRASRGVPWLRVLLVLGVVVAVAGTTAVGVVTRREGGPERPESQPSGPGPQSTPSKKKSATPKVRGPVLKKSAPVAIRIGSIGVQSRLLSLGLQRDGTVQDPPAKHADEAGWYAASPSPGEPGPAVIIGHSDRRKGMAPPVFRKLGKVRRGNLVEVARADKVVAVFKVTKVARYPVTHFPADEVYGPVDHAGLRLITCTPPGGPPRAGSTNVVVYASLVEGRPGG